MSDSQDVEFILNILIPEEIAQLNEITEDQHEVGYLVKEGEGEYIEIYVYNGRIPYLNKTCYQLRNWKEGNND